MRRNSNETLAWLLEEIKTAYQIGIEVIVNGNRYAPCREEEFSSILKTGDFMRDYIGDDQGKIVKMCYDKL